MILISLTDACRQLGIDAKTARRWLAQAQLPLQSHPGDARKRGLSREHLEVLARLHQRRLAPLSPVPPAPAPDAHPPLPAALLALPEQLNVVQAQLAALHQQVAELRRLLPPAPVSPPTRARRVPKSAPPAPRARPDVKPPRKPVHVIPRVEYGTEGRYVVICPQQGLLPFEPDTPEWFAWVAKQDSFRFVGKEGHFTAHHEWTTPRGAWRAHRQIRNHSYNVRLAPNQHLTIAVLEQAAHSLHAHLA